MIAATTSAVGLGILIDGSEGSANVGHSATTATCFRLGASAAVSDSRFAAGAGGPSVVPGPAPSAKVPTIVPASKCKLRLLKLERVKDYLLMEEEFVARQEQVKPQEETAQEERTKVDDIRGSPMGVASLEEMIDDNHAIISSSVGPEYYVNIMSFVDKDQLEPGCSLLTHNGQEEQGAPGDAARGGRRGADGGAAGAT